MILTLIFAVLFANAVLIVGVFGYWGLVLFIDYIREKLS